MALDCPIKKVKNAHPPRKKCHFVRTFTLPNICLLQVQKKSATLSELSLFQIYAYHKFFKEFQFHAKMIIQRNNKETLQFLKQIEWKKMSRTTLADEVACFFGAVKTKRTNTVESKIADYVKKEDQLRKSIFFKICKESGGLGPRGREPPEGFRLEDATLKSMISEEDASFNCDICGINFAGRD